MQSENAVPMSVFHGLVRRYPLPVYTDAKTLTEDINKGAFDNLFNKICDLVEKHWDGNNWVTRTRDEQAFFEAEDELEKQLAKYELDCGGLWDAADWLHDTIDDVIHEYGITADTPDDRLEEIATNLKGEVMEEGVFLYNTLDYLIEVRDGLSDTDDGE